MISEKEIMQSINTLSNKINDLSINLSKFYDGKHNTSMKDITTNDTVITELEVKVAELEDEVKALNSTTSTSTTNSSDETTTNS